MYILLVGKSCVCTYATYNYNYWLIFNQAIKKVFGENLNF